MLFVGTEELLMMVTRMCGVFGLRMKLLCVVCIRREHVFPGKTLETLFFLH